MQDWLPASSRKVEAVTHSCGLDALGWEPFLRVGSENVMVNTSSGVSAGQQEDNQPRISSRDFYNDIMAPDHRKVRSL